MTRDGSDTSKDSLWQLAAQQSVDGPSPFSVKTEFHRFRILHALALSMSVENLVDVHHFVKAIIRFWRPLRSRSIDNLSAQSVTRLASMRLT